MPFARPTIELVRQCHAALPERIRAYLIARGITNHLIDRHQLGWNGTRITIPIRDRDGNLVFFKLAKDPEDQSDSPKMLAPQGSRVELYGWEHLKAAPNWIVICEGEFDRLVLEAHGFIAITSTGGAGVFRREWAETLAQVPAVFICFDRDEAGKEGSRMVARMIPRSRIVELPPAVGEGGDITDLFVRLRRTDDDFLELVSRAYRLPQPDPALQRVSSRAPSLPNNEIAELKALVPIERVVRRRVELRESGRFLTGRCPFHEDRTPSFVVYPETRTFHCFGCRANGDVIAFLMRAEQLGFREALDALRKLAA